MCRTALSTSMRTSAWFGAMDPENDASRDLQRLRWIGVILPVAFVWAFELLRFLLVDPAYPGDESHVVGALLMCGAVLIFALAMSFFLDRAQHQLVSQNKDLTVTHAVSAALSGGLSLPDTVGAALERLVTLTGAVGGAVTIRPEGEGSPLVVQHPPRLSDGLDWVRRLLEEPHEGPLSAPIYYQRMEVDTGILDVPLSRAGESLGLIRLVYHPPIKPDLSIPALLDIAGETATAVELTRVVADLRRRERERAALYEVALQLTGRADLREVLDRITHHARDLLGAERAIVCLADVRPGNRAGWGDRLALSDDGTTCVLGHQGDGATHSHNAACPLQREGPPVALVAKPLRGPDGLLGELCVSRDSDRPFDEGERSLLGALADMAAIAVRTARLHDAEQQWVILSERDRIARELHDSLAQVLGVFHLRLRDLEARASNGARDGLPAELSELAEMADESYKDVREAILGLRETIPDDAGLEGALREYLRKFSRQTGIQANLVCEGETRGALEPRAEVQLLRVVQEALTNVRKHSGARRAVVGLDCRGPEPVLSIEDDGVGFDADSVGASFEGGFGLASMRERVEQVGGALTVHTAPGQGTRIVVHLEAQQERGAQPTSTSRAAGR
jgi:signal transduction histidine kinase